MCSIVALGVHGFSGMTAHGMKRPHTVDASPDDVSVCSTRSIGQSFVSSFCASYTKSPLGKELKILQGIKFQHGEKTVSLHTLLINALKTEVKDCSRSDLANQKIFDRWSAIETKTKYADQLICGTLRRLMNSHTKSVNEMEGLSSPKNPLFVFLKSLNALPNPQGTGALGDRIFALLKSSEAKDFKSIEAFLTVNEGAFLNQPRASVRRLLETLQLFAAAEEDFQERSLPCTPASFSEGELRPVDSQEAEPETHRKKNESKKIERSQRSWLPIFAAAALTGAVITALRWVKMQPNHGGSTVSRS